MNFWEFLTTTGAISTTVVLVARKFIDQLFSEKLEKFKSDLEKEVIRHKTTFETLHTERANVIKEVYKLISKTQRAFESLMKPLQEVGEPLQEEKIKLLVVEFNNFSNYYQENRLFFNEALVEEIDKLLQEFVDIWRQWNHVQYLRKTGEPNIEQWGQVWGSIRDKIPPIQKSIETKFRNIIGID